MENGWVKVGASSPKISLANPEANAREVLRLVREMEEKKVKVGVFPELCLTGYTCQDLFWQRSLLEGAKDALGFLARKTQETDLLFFVGLPLAVEGKLYNCAAALNHGEILGFVPKSCLPNFEGSEELRYFCSGKELDTFVEWEGEEIPVSGRLLFQCEGLPELVAGVRIGADLSDVTSASSELALAGATVIANLSADPELAGTAARRRGLLTAQSERLVCGCVYAGCGEGESTQDMVFAVHGLIAENGKLLAEGKRFRPGVTISEIDVFSLADARRRKTSFPAGEEPFETVSFTVEREETTLTRHYQKLPFVPEEEAELAGYCEEILEIQAMGLVQRMRHTGLPRMIVGLSGGLDSTLALLVMARACDRLGFSRDRILCVTMPCFGTTDRTYRNACALAKEIGAQLREIGIKDSILQHFRDIGHDPQVRDAAYENSQARERTQILMDLANQESALVVGTGDLSELALGWATYNGDHMSMYGVNASVPKTLVRYLVHHAAETGLAKEILLDILDTPVSPELLPPEEGRIAQKTEDLVGPYELHDFFLYYMQHMGFTPEKICTLACRVFAGDYAPETVQKWLKVFYRRFFSQQFKRSCLPDGPKVGSVSLSPRGGLCMSPDSSAAAWLR